MTTKELDAQIEALKADIARLRKEADRVRIAALDDPAAFAELPAIQTRLSAYPAQIGELVRRRVLAHLEELRAEVIALRPEYERLDALDTERSAALAAWRRDQRGQIPAAFDAYYADGRALDAQYDGVPAQYEKAWRALQVRYVWASQYGVGLDGSKEERVAMGRGATYFLPHSQEAWEAAARQRGETAARRALA